MRENVERNGLLLSEKTEGVNKRGVLLFAYLHDHMRSWDGCDNDHGPRAAEALIDISSTLLSDFGKRSDYKTATNELVDIKNQRMIQLWKYDPLLTGTISDNDPVSVYLSYSDCTDERVNKEKKVLISKAIEDSNANTWS